MKYKSYTLQNYKALPQINALPEDLIEAINVVGSVLPFKTNNYVVDNLIDWNNIPNDPIFVLTFPQKGMLRPHHYEQIKAVIKSGASKNEIKVIADQIRLELKSAPSRTTGS